MKIIIIYRKHQKEEEEVFKGNSENFQTYASIILRNKTLSTNLEGEKKIYK